MKIHRSQGLGKYSDSGVTGIEYPDDVIRATVPENISGLFEDSSDIKPGYYVHFNYNDCLGFWNPQEAVRKRRVYVRPDLVAERNKELT